MCRQKQNVECVPRPDSFHEDIQRRNLKQNATPHTEHQHCSFTIKENKNKNQSRHVPVFGTNCDHRHPPRVDIERKERRTKTNETANRGNGMAMGSGVRGCCSSSALNRPHREIRNQREQRSSKYIEGMECDGVTPSFWRSRDGQRSGEDTKWTEAQTLTVSGWIGLWTTTTSSNRV